MNADTSPACQTECASARSTHKDWDRFAAAIALCRNSKARILAGDTFAVEQGCLASRAGVIVHPEDPAQVVLVTAGVTAVSPFLTALVLSILLWRHLPAMD